MYDRVGLNRPYGTIQSAHVASSCPVWLYRRVKHYANALGPTRCVARTIRPQPGILQLPASCSSQPVQTVDLHISSCCTRRAGLLALRWELFFVCLWKLYLYTTPLYAECPHRIVRAIVVRIALSLSIPLRSRFALLCHYRIVWTIC